VAALERGRVAQDSPGVVVIPWRDWPETEEQWEAVELAHPGSRLFIPSTMSVDEWDENVPTAQAELIRETA
jgi:hypothetical protein